MRLRFALLVLFSVVLNAQEDPGFAERPDPPPASDASTAGLVDEDEDVLPKTEYVFNPLQAKKDFKVGNFYWKKGNHRAAAARYLEATRWNPGYGDAYWKLAEAREKLDQHAQALEAYRDYLQADPDGKQADSAKKRIAELEKIVEQSPLTAEDDR